jgi:hypothetical protein
MNHQNTTPSKDDEIETLLYQLRYILKQYKQEKKVIENLSNPTNGPSEMDREKERGSQ